MGLPGSGKTTYANRYKKIHDNPFSSFKEKVTIVDCDDLWKKAKQDKEDLRTRLMSITTGRNETYIFDGLFLTNDSLRWLIESFFSCPEEVEIHYWRPDIKKCLYNDKSRRTESSTQTIKTAKLETPELSLFYDHGVKKVNLEFHDVEKKPKWKYDADNLGLEVNDEYYLVSRKWTVGGINGSYTGDQHAIEPEEPLEFNELDQLLDKMCPNLYYKDYKRINEECVEIENDYVPDYYGGYTSYQYWKCDLEKLYSIIDEIKKKKFS